MLARIDRTKDWVNPRCYIWFNAANRKPANARIISLRFKSLIRLAHNDQTTANFHQLRKVATSLAFDKGLSITDLCARANWGSESVFFKHYYNKPNVNINCIALGKKC